MITATEVQDFFVGLMCTALGICVVGLVGALCWWAWNSESLINIFMIAGLMGAGACVLIIMLAAWLKVTEEKS
jgi:hypothetical protein